jgi:hypothetical protein
MGFPREVSAHFRRHEGMVRQVAIGNKLLALHHHQIHVRFPVLLSQRQNLRSSSANPRIQQFSSSSLIAKFNPMPAALLQRAQADPRMDTNTRIPGKGWFSFELNSSNDWQDALWWLNQSYECARKGNSS